MKCVPNRLLKNYPFPERVTNLSVNFPGAAAQPPHPGLGEGLRGGGRGLRPLASSPKKLFPSLLPWAAILCVALILSSAPLLAQTSPPAPIAPDKQAQMDEIRFTEIQDGVKKWVLVAARADYLKDQNAVELSQVQVEVFTKEGTVIKLSGDAASIHLKTRVLTVTGNVNADYEGYRFTTSQVIYQPKERQLLAPETVVLQGPQVSIEGRGLTVDLEHKKFLLQEHQLTRWQVAGKAGKR